MDSLKIESHKLMYHPERVAEWLAGKTVYPIYMEISPTSRCNHRCLFCAFDYVPNRTNDMETARLKDCVEELGRLGLKSAMYAGEGEPLLHPDMPEIIVHTKDCGIDVALATNASLMSPAISDIMLGSLSWVRASVNAGTPEGYRKVHNVDGKILQRVIDNLAYAVELKRARGYACRIGTQFVLIDENMEEVTELAVKLIEAGVDYFSVKPYLPHPQSVHEHQGGYDPLVLDRIESELMGLEKGSTSIIFRRHGFDKLIQQAKPYGRCNGVHFFCKLVSDGDVISCGPFLGLQDFCYGNIYENTFEEIWNSPRRSEVLKRIASLDTNKCMDNCRLDEINQYLWQLTVDPPEHVNFI